MGRLCRSTDQLPPIDFHQTGRWSGSGMGEGWGLKKNHFVEHQPRNAILLNENRRKSAYRARLTNGELRIWVVPAGQ